MTHPASGEPLDLSQARRIVVKLGTQLLMGEDGFLAFARLAAFVEDCLGLLRAGKELLIVTSGAVGLGRQSLKLFGPLTLNQKQACASVGQSVLMDTYRELFGRYGYNTGQILVTAEDFANRQHYLNLQKTLETLLEMRVVPVINENDTVATAELQEDSQTRAFGDNDKLSALVAGKLPADVLVILTNVDGLYTDNPFKNPQAEHIPQIDDFEQLSRIHFDGQSAFGRGGMASKIEAARIAAISGVNTLITSGLVPGRLSQIFLSQRPEDPLPGTLIRAHQETMPSRKQWIGYASGYNGVLTVNEGARKVLTERHASLLPVGIVDVLGRFGAGDVVSVQDGEGREIGRGVVNFSADDIRKIAGHPTQEIPQRLGGPAEVDEVIHRDNLVVFEEKRSV